MPKLPGLKAARERAVLTQMELAEKAGLGITTVNRVERLLDSARPSTVRKLAAALDVEMSKLMEPEQP